MTRYFIVLFLALSVGLSGCSKDKVVAEYKGGKITLKEFNEELNALPPALKSRYSTPQGKKEFLEQLVQQRLILRKAEEEGISKDPELIRMIEAYKRNLVQNKLMQKITSTSIDLTEEDLRKYYDTHIKEFSFPERYCLRRILIKDKNLGKKILRELNKKTLKFEDAVQKYSEDPLSKSRGGDLGCLQVNQRPDVPQEVFKLKPGTFSDLVEFNNYFYIYTVKEIMPAQTQNFDNVKESIRMRLTNMRRKELYENFIKELKEKANVKIYSEAIGEEGETKKGEQKN